MNMENIGLALEMMGQGMLGIFVVLGVIALLVAPVSYTHLTLPTIRLV